jgi:hypothetical protein
MDADVFRVPVSLHDVVAIGDEPPPIPGVVRSIKFEVCRVFRSQNDRIDLPW